jgi:hypothetical protein
MLGLRNMIDPDHFHDEDSLAKTQAKRIALTWDIQMRYSPLLQEVSNRSMDDPTRMRDLNELLSKMKAEMDLRFAETTKKPIIVPIEKKANGQLRKHQTLTPNTFVFQLGIKPSTCARTACGKMFIKSKTHKKYCSFGCEDLARKDRETKKRRDNKSTKPN